MSTNHSLPGLMELAEAQLRARDFPAAIGTLSRARELAPDSRAILEALVAVGMATGHIPPSSEASHSETAGDLLNRQALEVMRISQASASSRSSQGEGGHVQGSIELLPTDDDISVIKKIEELEARAIELPRDTLLLKSRRLAGLGRFEEALKALTGELMRFPDNSAARADFERLSDLLGRSRTPVCDPERRPFGSALPRDVLASIQKAGHCYAYRGVPMIKNPFDFAIYPLLMWKEKPRTIIEIGSKSGGSAVWLADMMGNFGIDGHVYSVDIVKVTDVSHERVTFIEGDGRNLGRTFSPEFLASLPRPLLVIEDADHSYETSIAVLRFFAPQLADHEMIVVEDGIISDLEGDPTFSSGPHRAIKEFCAAYRGEYAIESEYADFFGYNFTWCTNGFLRKTDRGINRSIPADLRASFKAIDCIKPGVRSHFSENELFQLFTLARGVSRRPGVPATFVQAGASCSSSLRLLSESMRAVHGDWRGISIGPEEPRGALGEGRLHSESLFHVPLPTKLALPRARDLLAQSGGLADLLLIDGEGPYSKVVEDIELCMPMLAPGGVIVFHDFLPALDASNSKEILFHYAGREPGARRACLEVLERGWDLELLEAPLLYPHDSSGARRHFPQIPGVISTIRAYRKR